MSEHGRILGVTEKPLGSTLVGDTPAGATSLTVVDAAEFDDQASGWLTINDQVIQYARVDDDTGVITLATGSSLAAAADEADKVLLYDPLFQTVAVDKRAQVVLDGPDDNSDAIDAGIVLHLIDKIPTGLRGDSGESVILEDDAGDWKIIDVLGLGDPNASGQLYYEDTHAVTSPGDQTFTLTFEPGDHSEHLYWNGLYQPASQWSRAGKDVIVPDATGLLRVDDELVVEYAYNVGKAAIDSQLTIVEQPIDPTLSPWGYPTSVIEGCTGIDTLGNHRHRVIVNFANIGAAMPNSNGWTIQPIIRNTDGSIGGVGITYSFTAAGGASPTTYASGDFGQQLGGPDHLGMFIGCFITVFGVQSNDGVIGHNDPAHGQFWVGAQILGHGDAMDIPCAATFAESTPWGS